MLKCSSPHLRRMIPRKAIYLLLLGFVFKHASACAQDLEQRQPLELVFADSIVPQDRHETMLTSGGWYYRDGSIHDAMFTQKVEWGISDQLQVATTAQLLRNTNVTGPSATGVGDLEVGARYTWPRVRSEFTHLAVALDAGFPSGNPDTGLGDAAYTLSPSLLASREFENGKYQLFTTSGLDFVIAHRPVAGIAQQDLRNLLFCNSGLSLHAGHGWAIGEIAVSSNRWNGGSETNVAFIPSYVRRVARRAELLLGLPIGLTPSTDPIGVVLKFTFEIGGNAEPPASAPSVAGPDGEARLEAAATGGSR